MKHHGSPSSQFLYKTLSLPDWHYRASPSTAQHNNGPNAACPGQPEWKHSVDLESLPSTGHTPEHDASSRQNVVETLRKCLVLERSLTLSNDSNVESPNQKPLFYWEDAFLLVLMGLRHYLCFCSDIPGFHGNFHVVRDLLGPPRASLGLGPWASGPCSASPTRAAQVSRYDASIGSRGLAAGKPAALSLSSPTKLPWHDG